MTTEMSENELASPNPRQHGQREKPVDHASPMSILSSTDDSIYRRPNLAEFPLSYPQERLWLIDQMGDGSSPQYNDIQPVEILGPLDVTRLEKALQNVVRRHEVLRAGFLRTLGAARQVIRPFTPFQVKVTDLEVLPREHRWESAVNELSAAGRTPFDLERDPLWRVQLWRIDARHHLLLLATHHIIFDGWSKTILLRELAMLYRGLALPTLPLQYADYAAWQRRRFDDRTATDKDLGFWRDHYRGEWPVLALPSRTRRFGTLSRHGARLPVEISPPLVTAIRRFAAMHSFTPFTVLMTAFQVILAARSGSIVPIATGVANRHRLEIEDLIGFFANTLLFRFDLSDDPDVASLLRRTHGTLLAGFARQEVPFEHVLAALGTRRDRNFPALQAVLTFQNLRIPELSFEGLALRLFDIDPDTSRFELELALIDFGNCITGNLYYDIDVLSAEDAGWVVNGFQLLCKKLPGEQQNTRASTLCSSLRRAEGGDMDKSGQNTARPRFSRVARRSMLTETTELVEIHKGAGSLPVLITPRRTTLDPIEWVFSSLPQIERELARSGAILFRGFRIRSLDDFERFASSFGRKPLPYMERSTPRTIIKNRIYTSTEYPSHQEIPMHNEGSYSHVHPSFIWFFCEQPAAEGGETVIADSREVLRLLPADLRAKFLCRGVMYLRNYGGSEQSLDLSWPQVFQTSSRTEVEKYCEAAGMAFEWRQDNRLRTRQVRPAIVQHPRSGEEVWFNQCHLFHVSSLGPDVAASLFASTHEQDLPRNAYYGDGERLEPSTLDLIRRSYEKLATAVAWQPADVLLLDNFLVAHGRKRFSGERRILVTMT
jgi:alpha-ketoglutarate-dependent taurine dioxygenase